MMKPQNVNISIRPDRVRGTVDPNVYGLHLEHIWNCVYPCVWVGRNARVFNVAGIRSDVADLLAALKPAVCKYPGGYFSDFYDWRDGVGAKRPTRVCPTQPGRRETNAFGTAEFIALCRRIGAEPYLAVSTTCLQPSEAAQWVEYCNRDKDTFWSDRRRKDGYAKPFNVRYWAIGNEQYWIHSAREYAERYKLWAHWMYNTDPDITLVLSGIEPGIEGLAKEPWNADGTWGEEALRLTGAGQELFAGDWHRRAEDRNILYSIHPYFAAEPDCTPKQYYQAFNELDRRLPRSIESTVKLLDKYRGKHPRPRLCFDEYGLLHPGTSMVGNMTQPAPFWAALWLGCFFQICHRYASDVAMATLPGMVNMEHALVLVEEGRAVATPSYHAFKMLRPHGGGQVLAMATGRDLKCPTLTRSALRTLATRSANGKTTTISLINLHLEKTVPVTVELKNERIHQARGQVLTAPLHARNSAQSPRTVQPTGMTLPIVQGKIRCDLPPHSLTVLETL